MSVKPAFLITIDTEGDNLWAAPVVITTENARWLPRFQQTCERFGLQPTYLTDYQMARCPVFADFGRQVLSRGVAEIGAHLHPWNTPPIRPLTENDDACGPYATEYAPELVAEKLAALTRRLEETFEAQMTSHRAGRWGFDSAYARSLLNQGYVVDCSVTPGVSWKSSPGKPGGEGGPDYSGAPSEPYFLDLDDVRRPGASGLLEVPVTIGSVAPAAIDRLRGRLPRRNLVRRALNRLYPPHAWLRPHGDNRRHMLWLVSRALERGSSCVEFMLHSSELMPGGSPTFPDWPSIEALYRDIEAVFAFAAPRFRSLTLTRFAREFQPAAIGVETC